MNLSSSAESRLKVQPMGWRVWLQAARPATLPAALAPVLLGIACGFHHGQVDAGGSVLCVLIALGIQIGTNFANDYFDFKKGADGPGRLGPTRVTSKGLVAPSAVAWATVITFAIVFLLGLILVAQVGWWLLLLGIAAILSGLLYTAGPFALAYTGLGDIFVLLFFGPVAVVTTTYINIGAWSQVAFMTSISVGMLITAILVVNNLRDRLSDAQVNKRTLVVRFGQRFGRLEYGTLLITSFGILIVGVVVGLLPRGTLLACFMIPKALIQIQKINQLDGAVLNAELAATAKLSLGVALLLAIGVSM
ncbi:MAG: 1,4-dihydroxy-2-naphthoate polyprenyltransferase [Myxococcota bacterium]|nr:1,4-dihydroxy-2-naphthoate polyprenyltransferase [Myxococcota bacterium]